MEDPKVPFADTTAHRAQLIAATERFKTSITDGVETIKEDATEVGKTTAFVAGAALAVYLVVNAVLPKSDEYRYAEKYGEPDDRGGNYSEEDDDHDDESYQPPSSQKINKKQKAKVKQTAAASGLISGLITSILTNLAREQLTGFLARIRTNNAFNSTDEPTRYAKRPPTEPVDHTSY